eukprot:XP_015579657.1 uncharacterized protein LOC107261895 [Ricinus communis]
MDMINNNIPKEALEIVVQLRQQHRTRQFLMKLGSKFEHIRASILNRKTNHCIDDIMAELLAEETRLQSLSSHDSTQDMALIASTYKPKARDISKVECFNCHEIGHLASQCRKKKDSTTPYCHYCKKNGHVIENCRKQPPRRKFKAYVASSSSNSTVAAVPSDSSDNNYGHSNSSCLLYWLSRYSMIYHWILHFSWTVSSFLEVQKATNRVQVSY